MIKPKLWKYKSGAKAGKLRPQAKEYLSYKLTEYHKTQRGEALKEKFQIKTRTRTQRVLNAESGGVNIGISIRGMAFNNNHTLKEIDNAIDEFLNSNPNLLHIPFYTEGTEENEPIDSDEDNRLNMKIITIELNIRGEVTYSEY